MTFTFVGTLATALDRVRVLVGDTEATRPMLADEAIEHYLGREPNDELAAARCRDLVLAQWHRQSALRRTAEIGEDNRQEWDLPGGTKAWCAETDRIRREGHQRAGGLLVHAL